MYSMLSLKGLCHEIEFLCSVIVTKVIFIVSACSYENTYYF
jgi:hypothetical protein